MLTKFILFRHQTAIHLNVCIIGPSLPELDEADIDTIQMIQIYSHISPAG